MQSEKGINVLSCFDGISCAQIALNRTCIKYNNYFASEVNKDSIKVTQHNYPKTIQIGNVVNIDTTKLPKIDLLCGGSPCQDLSRAKTSREGLRGEKSRLFWEYVRILKETNPKYFLLENVIMKQEWMEIINEELGVKGVKIDSNLLSCQNRKRMYWTNICKIEQPEDKGIKLGDILFNDTYKIFTDERITKTKKITKNYVKWDLSGKQHWSQQDRAYFKNKKICTLPKSKAKDKLNIVLDLDKDIYRKMCPIEAERCQNVPDNYTLVDGVKETTRFDLLGDGWTVDVIVHILKNIK